VYEKNVSIMVEIKTEKLHPKDKKKKKPSSASKSLEHKESADYIQNQLLILKARITANKEEWRTRKIRKIKKKNSKAIAWLSMRLSQEIFIAIAAKTDSISAKEFWEILKVKCSKISTEYYACLSSEWALLTMHPNEKLNQWTSHLEILCAKMEAAGVTKSEDERLIKLLENPNDAFENLAKALRIMDNLTYEKALIKMETEANRQELKS